MEKTIIIAPLVCLPTRKHVHAIGKGQEAAWGKERSKGKPAQRKPSKGRNSTGK